MDNFMYVLALMMMLTSILGSAFLRGPSRLLSKLNKPFSEVHASVKGFSSSIAGSSLQEIADTLRGIKDMDTSITNPSKCEHLSKVMSLMSEVTLADVGLSAASISRSKYSLCMDIVKTPSFHTAVFLLPQGHALPLHDHPEMAVLSKVVYGAVQIEAYSLSDDNTCSMTLTESRDETQQAWYLTPSNNNIHSFVATKPCLILDILLPPYDEGVGRHCTFYELKQKEGGAESCSLLPLKNYIPPHPVYNANGLYRGYRVK